MNHRCRWLRALYSLAASPSAVGTFLRTFLPSPLTLRGRLLSADGLNQVFVLSNLTALLTILLFIFHCLLFPMELCVSDALSSSLVLALSALLRASESFLA